MFSDATASRSSLTESQDRQPPPRPSSSGGWTRDWLAWLRRWTALSALLLLASTWRLWTLQSEFPSVPAFEFLCAAPPFLDWLGLGLLVIGLLLIAFGPRSATRPAMLVAILAGLLMIALDQHRLQPWLYQLLLFLSIMLVPDKTFALRWLTWLTISVYIYSAVGKLDFEFLHTVGRQFWGALYDLLAWTGPDPQPPHIAWVALLPVGELLIGVSLAFRWTRRAGGIAAVVFHLLLATILGPFALNHSSGVVLWNLQFAVQAILLFVLPPIPTPVAVVPPRSAKRLAIAKAAVSGMVGLALCLPVLERLGWWDHWPSWALYAPHSSRAEVWVARTAIERLPTSLQANMHIDDNLALWIRVPIERWSLSETGTPIYPQARFQLGVGTALAQSVDSEFEIKVVLLGASSRFSGARPSREFEGLSSILAAGRLFWLNTQPRRT